MWGGGAGWKSLFFKSCFELELLDFFIWNRLILFLALFSKSALLETAVPSSPILKHSLQTWTLYKIDFANANHLIPK